MESGSADPLMLMLRTFAVFAVAVAAVPHVVAQEPPDLDHHLTEDLRDQLDAGELVVLDDVVLDEPFGEDALIEGGTDLVFVVVDAPPDVAWEVLIDYDAQADFMPKMRTSEVKESEDGVDKVCFKHRIMLINSYNCFFVRNFADQRFQLGTLDPKNRDDRLKGVNYFWHARPWTDGRTLMVYYQRMDYSSGFSAFGHRAFVGPKNVVSAVRDEAVRRANEPED